MSRGNYPQILVRAVLIRQHGGHPSTKALVTTASTVIDPVATAPFATAKELARKLAELPQASYSKAKSTESFLSQIFKGESPFPIALRDEILRCLRSDGRFGATEYAAFEKRFSFIVTAHNEALKTDDSALEYAKEQLLSNFWLKVRSFESVVHFVISSRSMREANPDVITALFEVQAPTLNLMQASEIESNKSVYTIGKGLGKALWDREPLEGRFTYIVESKRSAFSLWRDLFAHLCETYIAEGGRYIAQTIPADIKMKAAKGLQRPDIESLFMVFYVEEDFSRICANLIVAINPQLLDNVSVFSAINGWIIPFSKHEGHAWRELVYVARTDFLSRAHPCLWKDVEATVMSEPLLSKFRKNVL